MNSVGTKMEPRTYGSSMCSIRSGGGSLEGFSTSSDLALGGEHPVAHARRGDDQGEVELALQALLDDLEVEHAEEAAAEPVAQGEGRLRLIVEGGVVEPELLERVAQPLVVGVLDGVEPGEDHGLGVAVAGAGLLGGPEHVGDGLADLRVGHALDGGGEVADLARGELLHRPHVGGEHADLLHLVGLAVGHEEDALARPAPGRR